MVSKTAPSDVWEPPGFADAAWRAIRAPALWDEQYEEVLKDRPWTFLHRVRFHLPAELADKQWTLVLGPVRNEDSTYLNGKLISVGGKGAPGTYDGSGALRLEPDKHAQGAPPAQRD